MPSANSEARKRHERDPEHHVSMEATIYRRALISIDRRLLDRRIVNIDRESLHYEIQRALEVGYQERH
jgi:hypothetical protein